LFWQGEIPYNAFMIKDPKKIPVVGHEHLHLHTMQGSLLDGFGSVSEYVDKCIENNNDFLCITDHGMMSAIPSQLKEIDNASKKKKLHHIFGCELYVSPYHTVPTPNEDVRKKFIDELPPEEVQKLKKSYHLLALAYNETGYKNLVRLTTWGFQYGYYYKPRVNRQILKECREGIIFSSCCYNSEIGQAFDKHGPEAAEEMLKLYMDLFPSKFILEIMMLDFKKQSPYNIFILKMKEKYHLPCILTQDVHYACKEDSKFQRNMLMIQGKRTIPELEKLKNDPDIDLFELQDTNLWFKSELELNEMWVNKFSDTIDFDIFQETKATTVNIARECKGVNLDRSIKFPSLLEEELTLKEQISKGISFRNIPKENRYHERIIEEYDLICRKGFASYFLITQKSLNGARENSKKILGWGNGREAVGCGRGSAAGSLVAYLLGITDVDPVIHGLLFSRFLSDARGGKQLILDFPD